MPLSAAVPVPALIVAPDKLMPFEVPAAEEVSEIAPLAVDSVAEVTEIVPAAAFNAKEPPPVAVMLSPELTVIPPAAFRVSVVAALQVIGELTVMLPVCAPLEPVETVTLAVANDVCRLVTFTTALLPVAV